MDVIDLLPVEEGMRVDEVYNTKTTRDSFKEIIEFNRRNYKDLISQVTLKKMEVRRTEPVMITLQAFVL